MKITVLRLLNFVDGGSYDNIESDNGLSYVPNRSSATGFSGSPVVMHLVLLLLQRAISDNESTAEENAIIFAADSVVTGGNLGLESDGSLTYNPNEGRVTATEQDLASNASSATALLI